MKKAWTWKTLPSNFLGCSLHCTY